MSDLHVVSETPITIVGGKRSGETIDVEFVEGVVYTIDDKDYVACIMKDNRKVLVSLEEDIYDYVSVVVGHFGWLA